MRPERKRRPGRGGADQLGGDRLPTSKPGPSRQRLPRLIGRHIGRAFLNAINAGGAHG